MAGDAVGAGGAPVKKTDPRMINAVMVPVVATPVLGIAARRHATALIFIVPLAAILAILPIGAQSGAPLTAIAARYDIFGERIRAEICVARCSIQRITVMVVGIAASVSHGAARAEMWVHMSGRCRPPAAAALS